MKILLTGGAGFIGSHVARRLLDLGHNVICVDNFDPYYDPKIKERNIQEFISNKKFVLYKEDICDFTIMEKIFRKERPDKVLHLAAKVGVRASIENPGAYIKTNIEGTLNLLRLSVKHDVDNFVFASSSSVYGNNKKIPFSEEDLTDMPISLYGASKKAGELLVYTYHHLYKLPCTILRFFTVYGPGGRPDMAPYLFVDAIYKGKRIRRFGKGDSSRDYTYIDDVVLGIISVLEKNFAFEIFNLGNSKPVKLNYFISVIEKLLGKKAKIREVSLQTGDAAVTFADISKAKKLLRYKPMISIEEGMKRFINWYLTHSTSSVSDALDKFD